MKKKSSVVDLNKNVVRFMKRSGAYFSFLGVKRQQAKGKVGGGLWRGLGIEEVRRRFALENMGRLECGNPGEGACWEGFLQAV